MLTRGTEGAVGWLLYLRKELMPMVTYGDLFEFVIMLCAVITLVLAIINAKSNVLSLVKVDVTS